MENYCISVDWLQTYCLGNLITEGEYTGKNYKFSIQLQDYETPQFKRVYKVMCRNLEYATIQQFPRTRVINAKATLVKLSNRVLYSQKYIEFLYDLQETLHLLYKGITRIDICYDCNKYFNGRSVPRFLKCYLEKDMGEIGSIYRRGSDKFTAHGSKSKTSVSKITSMRFGSDKSRIGAYVYDKTLELEEVKDKPWIRKMWEENGLVSTETEHVWRSEISIKSEGTDLLNMDSGQLFRLSPSYMQHAEAIKKLFYIYAQKVFDFRMCNGQKLKRNYDKLKLFECTEIISTKPYYVPTSADTGRVEKMCYNRLKLLSEKYTDLAEQRRISLSDTMQFLSELAGKKQSIVKREKENMYLDAIKGYKFLEMEDIIYFQALENARIKRQEIDAEDLYTWTYKNAQISQEELYNEWQASITPEAYIF